MFLSQEYKDPWSFTSKLIFRFLFIYFVLYILLMFMSSLYEPIFRWIGTSILGINYDYEVSGSGSGGLGGSSGAKKPEAKDAKEVAKKLIRTGAITAIQKSVEKKEREKSRGFKRSQGKQKKILSCFILG